jgi:hypothetical protein
LVYLRHLWSILRPFDIFYGHLVLIWYIFPCFGTFYQEKSGNPASTFCQTRREAKQWSEKNGLQDFFVKLSFFYLPLKSRSKAFFSIVSVTV